MTTAENYSMLHPSLITRNHARHESVSDVFDEFNNLVGHVYADDSMLDVVEWKEVKSFN